MSSFFDEASLVMIPSGYKDQKVYSVKPLDGSGDLTFSRASSATRVASNGLIEKVRTNLVLQSNTFSTTWGNDDSTETSGQAGYDGTNNAWLLTKTAANGRIGQVLSVSGSATFSVYAKAGTDSWLRLASSDGNVNGYFDLGTGAVGTLGSATSAKITSVGNGWYRCSISGNASFTFFNIWVADADNDTSGTSGNILIQAAQVETGDIATDYIATTTAAVSVGPVANVPRLDYLNSSCPRLLLEPQRTNLALYSEQFDNAAWNKVRATITANQAVAPDGTTSADLYTDGTFTNQSGFIDAPVVSTIGTAYTYSVFVKAGTSPFLFLGLYDTQDNGVMFNTSTQAITTFGTATNQKVEAYGNGWYRVSFTRVASATSIFPAISVRPTNSTANYNGTSSLTALYWGIQVEAGAYATSYIPTLSTSVTRVAELASKTGISSLIGQTEGTLFADFVYDGQTQSEIIDVSDGTESNRIMFYVSGGSQAQVYITNGGTGGFIASSFNIVAGTEYKIAIGYKANDIAFYINGAQIGTDTSLIIPATSKLTISNGGAGNYPMASRVAQALLFKTRLTNAQLAELTTL